MKLEQGCVGEMSVLNVNIHVVLLTVEPERRASSKTGRRDVFVPLLFFLCRTVLVKLK